MAQARSTTGLQLAKKWGLQVEHVLYRKTGDWYHQLRRFPGALLDARGYVIFETEPAYRACEQLRIRRDVNVPSGISSIPGYTRATASSARRTGSKTKFPTYESAVFLEGARDDVVQSKRERDPAARAACIRAHGYSCAVCSFDFSARYGTLGDKFIHVHHLKPLSEGEQTVNPRTDMRPVCPNCHAMLHRRNPPMTIEALRLLLHS
jgi:hypothetical protein